MWTKKRVIDSESNGRTQRMNELMQKFGARTLWLFANVTWCSNELRHNDKESDARFQVRKANGYFRTMSSLLTCWDRLSVCKSATRIYNIYRVIRDRTNRVNVSELVSARFHFFYFFYSVFMNEIALEIHFTMIATEKRVHAKNRIERNTRKGGATRL